MSETNIKILSYLKTKKNVIFLHGEEFICFYPDRCRYCISLKECGEFAGTIDNGDEINIILNRPQILELLLNKDVFDIKDKIIKRTYPWNELEKQKTIDTNKFNKLLLELHAKIYKYDVPNIVEEKRRINVSK